MQEIKYLNLAIDVKADARLMTMGKILFEGTKCTQLDAVKFKRYTDILINTHSKIKGDDYDVINSYLAQAIDDQNKETLENFNGFAQDHCKVLYEMFLNKPFDSEL
jgi:hypothetical protein